MHPTHRRRTLALAALATPMALAAQAPAESAPSTGAATPAQAHRLAPAVAAAPRAGIIEIDGRLDEPVWRTAPPATDFRQRDPVEGASATQRTEVRFAFDGDALYVGARMFDTRGRAGVRARLARRDAQPGDDYLMLVLDTYHDHVGRIVLRVDPSGVQYDALAAGSADPDPAWDAVWESATRIDSLGWTAELRIPFAQLRMPATAPQTWGLQIWRYEQRLNETSQWSFWSKREAGGPPAFGHLTGIEPSTGAIALEALPYASVARKPRAPAAASESRTIPAAGGDLRLRAPGLAATLTVHPDFGQVEVDPAVLNLTAAETYFPEKRPFFVQDAGVLAFGAIPCQACSGETPLRLYYSRRIGRPPSLPVAGRTVDLPTETTVLAAARLTAQSRRGWTIGVLGARTAAEQATLADSQGGIVPRPIEPAATALVARAERRARAGDATFGLTATGLDRAVRADASGALAAFLPARAFAGGSDADWWWSRRTYRATVLAATTQISGDPSAIARVQRSNVHDFQRPGRRERGGLFGTRFDTTRSVLRGFAGAARVARDAGSWTWEGIGEVVSGGFEANDLGFVPTAGTSWLAGNVGRAFNAPTRWYHEAHVAAGGEVVRNEDGDPIAREWHAQATVTTRDYWTVTAVGKLLPARYDDRRLRGGPTVGVPGGRADSLEIASDTRRAVALDASVWSRRERGGGSADGVAPMLTVRPSDAVTVSLGPRFEWQRIEGQLVAAAGAPARYVVATLRQRTAAVEARGAIALTPTLTIDAFAQPFLSSGRFDEFGEYAAPRSPRRLRYGREIGTISRAGTDSLVVDPDGPGPAAPLTFADPTGSVRSFRSSSVLRWAYRPGAALSIAWTQTRLADDGTGALDLSRDGAALFRSRPTNAFVAKLTYRLGK